MNCPHCDADVDPDEQTIIDDEQYGMARQIEPEEYTCPNGHTFLP